MIMIIRSSYSFLSACTRFCLKAMRIATKLNMAPLKITKPEMAGAKHTGWSKAKKSKKRQGAQHCTNQDDQDENNPNCLFYNLKAISILTWQNR